MFSLYGLGTVLTFKEGFTLNGHIEIHQISKSFGQTEVLTNVDLDIKAGTFTILLGPSGCGKTTLLRIIAGLEKPDDGDVSMDGEIITDYEPKNRHIAMVFQNYALYPHMTAYKNIEYGLKIKGIKKAERRKLVEEVLTQIEMTDQANKLPKKMSGGQKQRIALARAMVKRPKVFLMDEPLSNLDAKLRNYMRLELIDLFKKLNTTFLYVTHDQVEAMSMGTHIIVMNHGEIMQEGTPRDIYENPQNLFVAQFIGSPPANIIQFDNYSIGIRSEDISLRRNALDELCLPCDVYATEQLGSETVRHLNTPFGQIDLKTTSNWDEYGTGLFVVFNRDKLLLFDRNGKRISNNPDLITDFEQRIVASIGTSPTSDA
jgi:sn-glycerol 3-phosphate transport system ATP-binding protein